ncbi:carbonic anhydrase 4-like isoform X2 [Lepisosteus oculatus]|uniref:carbonic anhydrase 4-like isoform X2 n=1 Tax=Lepisosteus oculatus TaxID=7918 RepID=UPI003710F46C
MRAVLSLLTLLCSAPGAAGDWCYQSQFSCNETCEEPAHWADQHPYCGGRRQSPINVVTRKAQYDSSLEPFTFEGYDQTHSVTAENLGHSVRTQGGHMPDWYKAVNFHLHWGWEAGPGSEHTIDGEQFPMELHIVHIHRKYKTIADAAKDSAGIAVLAFFFEESSQDNPYYKVLIDALDEVKHAGNRTIITALQLVSILPKPQDLRKYYYYSGSVTVPDCDEAVVWAVFETPIRISREQLTAFSQKLLFRTEKPMKMTFRPTQPLNGRVVLRSSAGLLSFSLATLSLAVVWTSPGLRLFL